MVRCEECGLVATYELNNKTFCTGCLNKLLLTPSEFNEPKEIVSIKQSNPILDDILLEVLND